MELAVLSHGMLLTANASAAPSGLSNDALFSLENSDLNEAIV